MRLRKHAACATTALSNDKNILSPEKKNEMAIECSWETPALRVTFLFVFVLMDFALHKNNLTNFIIFQLLCWLYKLLYKPLTINFFSFPRTDHSVCQTTLLSS